MNKALLCKPLGGKADYNNTMQMPHQLSYRYSPCFPIKIWRTITYHIQLRSNCPLQFHLLLYNTSLLLSNCRSREGKNRRQFLSLKCYFTEKAAQNLPLVFCFLPLQSSKIKEQLFTLPCRNNLLRKCTTEPREWGQWSPPLSKTHHHKLCILFV